MGAGLDRLAQDLIMVQQTGSRRVGLLTEVHAQFEALEVRWKRKLERHFKHYGIPGTTMPKEHFNSEGRHPTGGPRSKEVHIYAFKAFQCRIYGVVVPIRGFPTFAGLELVNDKKKNRADQDLLRRVARRFGQYED
jgi:hypothetical protein